MKRRHLGSVYFTRRLRDLFLKTYWVACYRCDYKVGPFADVGFAKFVATTLNGECRG